MLLPALAFLALLVGVFLVTPVKVLADILRSAVPIILVGFGALLIFAKQAGLGAMLFFAGIALWRRTRAAQSRAKATEYSGKRTAALEVEIDSANQVQNGVVLAGRFEGHLLEDLTLDELQKLRQ
jgi:hypothetical protein